MELLIKPAQIFYKEEQKQFLNPMCIHVDNSRAVNSPCLENHVIVGLIAQGLHENCDYFGVFSWAFEKKRAISFKQIVKYIEIDEAKHDVYAFDSMHTKDNMWQKAEQWHPGITEVTREVFKEMGIYNDFDKIKTPNIYSNAFLCKPVIYEVYVNAILRPFMNILVNEQGAMIDSRYKKKERDSEHLMKATGYPYYTLMPFICERLFATFLAYQPEFKLKHIA